LLLSGLQAAQRNGKKFHAAVNPPSSAKTWPVIDAAAGLTR
jgi:hypothetical protein